MKSKQTNEGRKDANGGNAFGGVRVKSCRGILARISKSRDAIFAEARGKLKVQERMLRLALNEAEALAWQTLYPHLVFPALAVEKVQGIAVWNLHQRLIGGQIRSFPFEN